MATSRACPHEPWSNHARQLVALGLGIGSLRVSQTRGMSHLTRPGVVLLSRLARQLVFAQEDTVRPLGF